MALPLAEARGCRGGSSRRQRPSFPRRWEALWSLGRGQPGPLPGSRRKRTGSQGSSRRLTTRSSERRGGVLGFYLALWPAVAELGFVRLRLVTLMARALLTSWHSLLHSDAPPRSARYRRDLLAVYSVFLAGIVTVVLSAPTFDPWQLNGVAMVSALLLHHVVFAFPWPPSPSRVFVRALTAVLVSLVFLIIAVADIIWFAHHLSARA